MKFNFKKITSVLASAVMLGSTFGFAAAATYPAPFVQGGNPDVGIVVTSGSHVGSSNDLLGAVNIAQNLQAELARQTATSGTSDASVSGEGVNLATSSRKIYYGDSINVGRPTLTETELPNVLADGTFEDLTGTTYTYSQLITVGDTVSEFGTSGGDLDEPALYLAVGTTATDPLYNYTLTLNKELNVSDGTNVQGQKINILGVDYIVGSNSDQTTLYLYGSGETVSVSAGESRTVTIGESDHVVELIAAETSTTGQLSIDGLTKSVTEGSSYTFSGGIVIYVKDIIYQQYAGGLQRAELIIGANSLKLENGKTVREGTGTGTKIDKTKATIKAGSGDLISGFTVEVAMAENDLDHIGVGGSFVDPVFGGLKVDLASATPALDSESRGSITIDTDGSRTAYVTFESARASEELKFAYAHDNTTATTSVQPLLAYDSTEVDGKGFIHVLEGENAKEGDLIVINQGDMGTILKVDDISTDVDETTGTVEFTDVLTGEDIEQTLTNGTGGFSLASATLGGGTGYSIWAQGEGSSGTVNITWDGTTATTLFPRIKLKDGGWIALLTETTVANATAVVLPNGITTITTDGTKVSNETPYQVIEGINWTKRNSAGSVVIDGIGASTNDGACNFNSTNGPAVLFIEPKKWDDPSYGDYICIPLKTEGTTTTEIAVNTPIIGGSHPAFVTLESDSDIRQTVDKFGSFIQEDGNENNEITITYPGSQMFLDVLFAAEGATVTPGSSGTGSVETLGSITKRDNEISAIQDRNLIIIGGSCINAAAAKALGVSEGTCGSAFTDATGVGADQFLIKVVDSPYASGKIAMVVAGYEAADTTDAIEYVTNELETTDVGTELKKISATYADVA